MTGNGKIARLPLFIRNQLNERLQNGEEGKELVDWLNSLRVVQGLLVEKFGGRPISEQNLSGWKQRGYEDWCRREEKRALLRDFLDEAEELEEEVGETALTDRVSELTTLALLQSLRAGLNNREKDPRERASLLLTIRELTRARDSDHEMERLRLQRERWEVDRERLRDQDRKREIAEHKTDLRRRIFAALNRKTLIKAFGGGELGEKIADLLDFVDWGTPLPTERWKESHEVDSPGDSQMAAHGADDGVNQSKSGQIKANPTHKANGQHADCR
jgi:hypothetical protein